MRRLTVLAALPIAAAFAWTPPAQASGGVSCRASDSAVRVSAGAAASRGSGAIIQAGADLTLSSPSVPRDLARTRFRLDDLAQSWFGDGMLKLGFYRERGAGRPHGFVSLKIEVEADPDDEGSYRGRYRVTVYDVGGSGEPERFSGRATCEVG